MSSDKVEATFHGGIIPPNLIYRARVGVIFAHRIAQAQELKNSPLEAELEALRVEVLAALDPHVEGGGSHS